MYIPYVFYHKKISKANAEVQGKSIHSQLLLGMFICIYHKMIDSVNKKIRKGIVYLNNRTQLLDWAFHLEAAHILQPVTPVSNQIISISSSIITSVSHTPLLFSFNYKDPDY